MPSRTPLNHLTRIIEAATARPQITPRLPTPTTGASTASTAVGLLPLLRLLGLLRVSLL
jgi:hypothetical protein